MNGTEFLKKAFILSALSSVCLQTHLKVHSGQIWEKYTELPIVALQMKSIPHKGTSSRVSVYPIKTESVLLRSPAAQSRFEIFVLSSPELLYGSIKWETHPGGCSGSTDSVLVKTLSLAWLWSAFPGVFVVATNPDGDQHVRSIFHPLIFTELSRCEKRFWKWLTMLKIINITNPVQYRLFSSYCPEENGRWDRQKKLRIHTSPPSIRGDKAT